MGQTKPTSTFDDIKYGNSRSALHRNPTRLIYSCVQGFILEIGLV